MEKYIVKQTDLIGQLQGFPIEVVQKMVDYQVLQGNKPDIIVFQNNVVAPLIHHGFNWGDTKEGTVFWHKVISSQDFTLFYEKYSKGEEEQQPKPAPDIPEGLRPFDIEKVKAGAEIVTRDGKPVRVICYDRLSEDYPLVALIKGDDGSEDLQIYTELGQYVKTTHVKNNSLDLFIKPAKKTGWVNIYKSEGGSIYATEVYPSYKEAEDAHGINYTATCKIEWEE